MKLTMLFFHSQPAHDYTGQLDMGQLEWNIVAWPQIAAKVYRKTLNPLIISDHDIS
jgi:hypothetical protein